MNTESSFIKVDLGCGLRKQEGFIGVDRFPMPDVDIIADIDQRLPFEDNSVDLLFSSHSLEHVHDLMSTMREIYRVCKHGAQVCIVAPYYEQKLNIANPYHLGVFNEHTPRFWTHYSETPVSPEDYPDPVQRPWGLSKSDNSDPGLDIRLVNMEFFYFPRYRHLPIEQKRTLRNERLDVCEQIMYQLIVWKGDEGFPEDGYANHLEEFVPYEPHYIRQLKMQEREELINKHNQERTRLVQQIAEMQKQLPQHEPIQPLLRDERRINELIDDRERVERALHDARSENHQLRIQVTGLFERLEILNSQFHSTSTQLVKVQTDAIDAGNSVITLAIENQELRNKLEATVHAQLDEVQSEVVNSGNAISGLTSEIQQLRDSVESNANALLARRSEVYETERTLIEISNENRELRTRLEVAAKVNAKVALLKAELEAADGVIGWFRAKEASWDGEISHLQAELNKAQQAHSSLQEEALRLNGELHHAQQVSNNHRDEARQVVQSLYRELMDYRTSRSIRIASSLKRNDALWNAVSPAFELVKAYTASHLRKMSKARLILGDDLCTIPYREYQMPLALNSLSSVTLAICPLLKATQGVVGIEVVSSNQEVIAQSVQPLVTINPDVPTHFSIAAPIASLGKNWFLRVFVKDADIPVSIYEQVHYSITKQNIKYLPFALLQ